MIVSLASSPFPVQLRLALSQTAAGGSDTPTLRAFSQALSFFERPNARDILRELHQRVAAAPRKPQAQAAPAPGLPVQHNVPAPAAPTTETTSRASTPTTESATKATIPGQTALAATSTRGTTTIGSMRGRRVTWRLAAAAALVIAGSGSLMFFGAGAANSEIHTAMGSVRETLLWPASGTPSKAVEEPPAAAETPGTPKPLTSRAPEAAHRSAAANARSESALPRPPEPVADRVALPLLTRGPFETAPIPRVDAVAYPERESAAMRLDARVYSSADSGVRPPRPIYPKLPDPDSSPIDATRRDAAVVELLIGTDGLVERVKLTTAPRTIHDIMLLSAAKEWRFDPASRDGAPVRFLYRVAIVQ
jgi:hypothetical protein